MKAKIMYITKQFKQLQHFKKSMEPVNLKLYEVAYQYQDILRNKYFVNDDNFQLGILNMFLEDNTLLFEDDLRYAGLKICQLGRTSSFYVVSDEITSEFYYNNLKDCIYNNLNSIIYEEDCFEDIIDNLDDDKKLLDIISVFENDEENIMELLNDISVCLDTLTDECLNILDFLKMIDDFKGNQIEIFNDWLESSEEFINKYRYLDIDCIV